MSYYFKRNNFLIMMSTNGDLGGLASTLSKLSFGFSSAPSVKVSDCADSGKVYESLFQPFSEQLLIHNYHLMARVSLILTDALLKKEKTSLSTQELHQLREGRIVGLNKKKCTCQNQCFHAGFQSICIMLLDATHNNRQSSHKIH